MLGVRHPLKLLQLPRPAHVCPDVLIHTSAFVPACSLRRIVLHQMIHQPAQLYRVKVRAPGGAVHRLHSHAFNSHTQACGAHTRIPAHQQALLRAPLTCRPRCGSGGPPHGAPSSHPHAHPLRVAERPAPLPQPPQRPHPQPHAHNHSHGADPHTGSGNAAGQGHNRRIALHGVGRVGVMRAHVMRG